MSRAEAIWREAEKQLEEQANALHREFEADRQRSSMLAQALQLAHSARVKAEMECSQLRHLLYRKSDTIRSRVAHSVSHRRTKRCRQRIVQLWKDRLERLQHNRNAHLRAALFRDRWKQRKKLLHWRSFAFFAQRERHKHEVHFASEHARREAQEEQADTLNKLHSQVNSLSSSLQQAESEKMQLKQTLNAFMRGVCALNVEALKYDSSTNVTSAAQQLQAAQAQLQQYEHGDAREPTAGCASADVTIPTDEAASA